MLRFFPLALLPALLSGCGTLGIEVRRQPLSGFTLQTDLESGTLFTDPSSRVAYLSTSQFNQAVSFVKVRIQADATYRSLTPTGPVTLNFFVRPAKPSDCELLNERYYVCESESATRRVGGVTLEAGVAQSVTLEGSALDEAVGRGEGYMGLQLAAGRLFATDTLEFSNVVAVATL